MTFHTSFLKPFPKAHRIQWSASELVLKNNRLSCTGTYSNPLPAFRIFSRVSLFCLFFYFFFWGGGLFPTGVADKTNLRAPCSNIIRSTRTSCLGCIRWKTRSRPTNQIVALNLIIVGRGNSKRHYACKSSRYFFFSSLVYMVTILPAYPYKNIVSPFNCVIIINALLYVKIKHTHNTPFHD